MGEEQRRDQRAGTRLTAFLKDLKTGKVRRALTKDISAGGFCVVTIDPKERALLQYYAKLTPPPAVP